jgi:hypothetical protein
MESKWETGDMLGVCSLVGLLYRGQGAYARVGVDESDDLEANAHSPRYGATPTVESAADNPFSDE